MAHQHALPITSIRNARELGGYIGCNGKRIKNGVLLRTACLYGISDEDVRLLMDVYRLEHIVDFRMDMELSQAQDPPISGAEYHHLNVIDTSNLPDEDESGSDASPTDIVRSVELSEKIGAFDGSMYVGFLSSQVGKKAYSDFFRLLLSADPDRAVLWHCTSGKDRTGIAAMLLMSALGVDENVITDDYLLTNTFNAQRIEKTTRYLKSKGFDDEFIRKAVLVLDSVDERIMRHAIAYLKDNYGSVVGYVVSELNVSESDIEDLKNKYLE